MYEGLPITTNKLPLEERKGIPHHLLGCVKLGQEAWTVKQFLERAIGIIREIRSRGRLPILVGGTHYYTQSLLFTDTIVEAGNRDGLATEAQPQKWHLLDASAEEMLKELRKVDPGMAMRWHPSDRRKIRRSLEIWLTTGKRASEMYEQQKTPSLHVESRGWIKGAEPNNSNAAARSHARFDSLILWVHASSDVLNPRLEERVDRMVSHGLLDEVTSMQSFLQNQEQQGDHIDQTRGIWVAIGFKEFLPYILDGSRSDKLRLECIERIKIATRQYAKRQVRWIRLRLQRAVHAANLMDNMLLLDATDSSRWSEAVDGEAQDITAAFISGRALPKPDSLSDAAIRILDSPEGEAKYARYCEACDKTLMSHSQWVNHLRSKGHRASVRPKVNWKTLYPKTNDQR